MISPSSPSFGGPKGGKKKNRGLRRRFFLAPSAVGEAGYCLFEGGGTGALRCCVFVSCWLSPRNRSKFQGRKREERNNGPQTNKRPQQRLLGCVASGGTAKELYSTIMQLLKGFDRGADAVQPKIVAFGSDDEHLMTGGEKGLLQFFRDACLSGMGIMQLTDKCHLLQTALKWALQEDVEYKALDKKVLSGNAFYGINPKLLCQLRQRSIDQPLPPTWKAWLRDRDTNRWGRARERKTFEKTRSPVAPHNIRWAERRFSRFFWRTVGGW